MASGGHALTFQLGAVVAVIAVYAQRVGGVHGDDAYLIGWKLLLPERAYLLLAIALFGMGMSTASGFLNWGSGMVAALLPPTTSDAHRYRWGKSILLGLAAWSTAIAFHMDSLLDGIQFVLAIPSLTPCPFAAELALATALNTGGWLTVAFLTNTPDDLQQFHAFRQACRLDISTRKVIQVLGIGAVAFSGVLLLRQLLFGLQN